MGQTGVDVCIERGVGGRLDLFYLRTSTDPTDQCKNCKMYTTAHSRIRAKVILPSIAVTAITANEADVTCPSENSAGHANTADLRRRGPQTFFRCHPPRLTTLHPFLPPDYLVAVAKPVMCDHDPPIPPFQPHPMISRNDPIYPAALEQPSPLHLRHFDWSTEAEVAAGRQLSRNCCFGRAYRLAESFSCMRVTCEVVLPSRTRAPCRVIVRDVY